MLNYNVDATFVIGSLGENIIGISGRSNGNINVGNVLSQLGGGGNQVSATTKIEDNDIIGINKRLQLILAHANKVNN